MATPPPEIYTLSLHDALPILPQIGGMYGGDRSRKIPLVDYGFRLPSALDNRPLTFADRKSTRLNSSHVAISYAVFCLKKKKILLAVVHHIPPIALETPRLHSS